jgi:Fur family transcriptional regulator, ferric uptake regulator
MKDELRTAPRSTRQKTAILDALGGSRGFASAQEIHNALREANSDVGLATVYRALKSFCESGEVDVIHSEGEARYRICDSTQHHHHLVCRGCGASVEIQNPELEAWALEVADKYGFQPVGHTLEIYGDCRSCTGTHEHP